MSALRQRTTEPLSPALRVAYQRLVEERTGIRLSGQQVRELDETVATVLAQAGRDATPAELYRTMERDSRGDLFAALAERLTIGETHFFRVAPQIAALREVVLPDLLARRTSQRRLDLWSAGCSSGEEPYTLAMLLHELLPAPERWNIRLLATDLSEAALAVARRATYREWSFRETPAQIRRRYFDREGATWRLREPIRRMVGFERLNLVADRFPAPSAATAALDLILCRNVTIYFGQAVIDRLYRRFAEALAPGGWLLVGPSDPAPGGLFEPIYLKGAILWRKAAGSPPRVFPAAQPIVAAPRTQSAPPVDSGTSRQSRPSGDMSRNRRAVPSGPTPARTPAEPHESWLAEACSLARSGERRAARERLAKLVVAAPLAVAAHRLLGFLALEDGEPAAALDSLRRATFLAADDPLAQFGLGRAYRALGDTARASAAFRQARRALAPWSGERAIPGDEGLTADELRQAIEAQLGGGDGREGNAP